MIDAAAAHAPARQEKAVFSDRYKKLVLALLLLAYIFNFIDRTIIGTIGPKIREDLGLTSTQLGLLGGLYFALLYTILGIPIARLAERHNRVGIIALAVLVWSGFTVLCGFATSFAMLAACRFGVGIGEAGLSPPAQSLISDYFESRKRASALGVYTLGIPLGAMFGAIFGGWIVEHFSWRMAFIIVGLPGVLIALLIRLLIKEPPRGHSEAPPVALTVEALTPAAVEAPAGHWMKAEMRELKAVSASLFGCRPVLHMILAITLTSIANYGTIQFAPQYFRAAFHLNMAQVGLIIGLVTGLSAGSGALLGGFLSDRLSRRSPAWYSLTPALGILVAIPLYILAYLQHSWLIATLILLIPGVFHYTYLAPSYAVVQNMVEPRRRATAAAVVLFFANLIALGGGPPLTGWLIDQFGQYYVNHAEPHRLLDGLTHMFAGGAGLDVQSLCPGGVARAESDPALKALCQRVLADSTRSGILTTIVFHALASVNYFLGAIGLSKALEAARRERGEVI